jgi:hypothetical protein
MKYHFSKLRSRNLIPMSKFPQSAYLHRARSALRKNNYANMKGSQQSEHTAVRDMYVSQEQKNKNMRVIVYMHTFAKNESNRPFRRRVTCGLTLQLLQNEKRSREMLVFQIA